MSKLEEMDELKERAEGQKRTGPRTAKSICERILTVPGETTLTVAARVVCPAMQPVRFNIRHCEISPHNEPA